MAELSVRRLGYALGAEVRGVNIAAGVDEETFAAIKRAWLEHIVLCFPDQELTLPQLTAFCRRFGELDDNRSTPQARDPEFPEVQLVVNKPIEIKGKSFKGMFTNRWHTDRSFTNQPTAATFLHAVTLPDVGGNTMFANQYMAYETLSPAYRNLLDPLEAVHDIAQYIDINKDAAIQKVMENASPPHVHPVVATHPDTGRKSLYVGAHVRKILGMTEDESMPILGYLREHGTRYEFCYRHVWKLHDLVMWDNRCALHYAVKDYDVSQLRLLRKCSAMRPKSGYRYLGDDLAGAASREAVPASG